MPGTLQCKIMEQFGLGRTFYEPPPTTKVAYSPIQPGLEHFEGWGLHGFSGLSIPVPPHAHFLLTPNITLTLERLPLALSLHASGYKHCQGISEGPEQLSLILLLRRGWFSRPFSWLSPFLSFFHFLGVSFTHDISMHPPGAGQVSHSITSCMTSGKLARALDVCLPARRRAVLF